MIDPGSVPQPRVSSGATSLHQVQHIRVQADFPGTKGNISGFHIEVD